jgi:hypothetical protein
VMPLSGVFNVLCRLKPSALAVGTPASNGCEKKMPNPPRRTVLSEWKSFQAKPKRGPKLFQSVG